MNISIQQIDITMLEVDAIVNAANSSLLGGGGVDGAIHRKGAPQILEACRDIRNRQGKCATGEAVITTAGLLPAQYVIHTVGPVWNGGTKSEGEKLKSCYLRSLEIACEKQIKSIAFPNISTGIYRFPKQLAAEIAFETVRNFQHIHSPDVVVFACYDSENYDIYQNIQNEQSKST